MSDRVILHVDMNAFFASVETLFHPEVEGRPMAVAGNPENRHGIILAKNELAKKAGVKTAETIWNAKKKCPGLLLLPPHHSLYQEYCEKANNIYEQFTDLVEQAGIDESYLDVTGTTHLFGSGEQIANSIRQAVKDQLGLTVSVGVSFCKVFAKMGSDLRKPDFTNVISRENYKEIIYPLPVTDLMFVGKATAKQLNDMGVRTLGELARLEEPLLTRHFGKHGQTLYTYVHGLDDQPVIRAENAQDVQSVGNSLTFKRNLITKNDVSLGMKTLSESVAYRLRKHEKKCQGVQIAIKTPDFKTLERQVQLEYPTHLTKTIYSAAMDLALKWWKEGQPIRLLSVTAINLVDTDASRQISMFETGQDTKQEALERALDSLKDTYGKTVVKPASKIKNDLGIK